MPCKRGHTAVKDSGTGWCSECRRLSKKKWYWDHREKMLAAANRYNSQHREQQRIYTKTYYSTHSKDKDSKTASEHKRRAFKKGSLGTYTKSDVKRILIAQGFRCVGCKADIQNCYSIDHITPLSRGGSNSAENIQLLCLSCNCRKGAKTMEEWNAVR